MENRDVKVPSIIYKTLALPSEKGCWIIHYTGWGRKTESLPKIVHTVLLKGRITNALPLPVRQPYLSYRICRPFKEPGIDSKLAGRYDNPICRTGLPARLHRPAESVLRNRFPGSINVYKYGLKGQIGRRNRFLGIGSWLHKRFQIRTLVAHVQRFNNAYSWISFLHQLTQSFAFLK